MLTPFKLTPIALLLGWVAGRTSLFGRATAAVETASYSGTVFLLMIPTFTETLTRVPPGAPWVSSPEAPVLLAIDGLLLLLFVAGVRLQLRLQRRQTA